MPNLTQMRLAARQIFEDALRAADPTGPMLRTLRIEGSSLICDDESQFEIGSRAIYSIAIGKAAGKMSAALAQILGAKLAGAVIATNDFTHVQENGRFELFKAGHPEPNQESLAAAKAAFALLKRADEERALVIFLISGGGSAMIEWPISEDITLADLRTANAVLIKSGASIGEINSVRRSFSAVKGGRLAALAPDCDQLTLVISDVPHGEERSVASGPSLSPPANAPDPLEVIKHYGLGSVLPQPVLRAAENQGSMTEALSRYHVLLRNRDALNEAAASAGRRGFSSSIAANISDGPIEKGVGKLTEEQSALRVANRDGVVCLISGGEFSCPVRGDGIGGRNLETALRLAIEIDSGSGNFVALCAATDGIDGNSPAAGAIVDSTTILRARAIGLDPKDFLDRSDAYSFFVALGDVFATGPTGTNVRDLRILLKS